MLQDFNSSFGNQRYIDRYGCDWSDLVDQEEDEKKEEDDDEEEIYCVRCNDTGCSHCYMTEI